MFRYTPCVPCRRPKRAAVTWRDCLARHQAPVPTERRGWRWPSAPPERSNGSHPAGGVAGWWGTVKMAGDLIVHEASAGGGAGGHRGGEGPMRCICMVGIQQREQRAGGCAPMMAENPFEVLSQN